MVVAYAITARDFCRIITKVIAMNQNVKSRCSKLEAKYQNEAKQLGLSGSACQKYVKTCERYDEYIYAECADAFQKFYRVIKKLMFLKR